MDLRQDIVRTLSDGRFHSGEVLAETYKISRAAVWKHIAHIREDWNIAVSSVKGKGYRLAMPLELLDQACIQSAMSDASISLMSKLEIVQQIDSTNSYLMRRIPEGMVSGYACLAEQQTAGRGRRGRRWVSPFGSNIYLSIYWKYHLDLAAITGLSLAAGLVVIKVLKRFGVKGVGLKWPNDVLWRDRKLAGLLLEATGEQGGPSHVVLGLGLNSRVDNRQAKEIDQPWIDLSRLDSGDLSRNTLAAGLLDGLFEALCQFEATGFTPLIQQWTEHDLYFGETVRLQLGDRYVVGKHCGVNESGALLLREAGVIRAYHGGELSLRAMQRA